MLFLLVEGNYIDTRTNIKLYYIPNVKNVLAMSICYVTKAVISSLPFTEGMYEGWNLNSGNYLFTTDKNRYMFRSFTVLQYSHSIVYNPLPAMWKS